MRSAQILFFSRLNKYSSLCLSLQEKCSSPLIIFEAPLWTLSRSTSFLCWGPMPGAVLHMGPYEGRVEGNNHPSPRCHPSVDATQDAVGLWAASTHCLFSNFYLLGPRNPQQGFGRAALKEFFSQSVRISGIAPPQVQHPAFGLVKLHQVHVGLFKPAQVIMDASLPSAVSAASLSLLSSANLLRVYLMVLCHRQR